MNFKSITILILLSAIWGTSYMFMKVLSPVYGAFFVAFSRIFIGGISILIYCKAVGIKLNFKKNLKEYLITGLVGCGIPFTCFCFAALYIDASLSVILNALTPIFVSLFGIYFLKEKLSVKQIIGLLIAFGGVLYISFLNGIGNSYSIVIGVILILIAVQCYALNNIYAKLKTNHIPSSALTAGGLLVTSLLMMPFAFMTLETTEVSHLFELLFLGIICTGVAFVLYYRLVAMIGTKALTTTLLQPPFGVLWAFLFLGENITVLLIGGIIITIIGVYIFLSDKLK